MKLPTGFENAPFELIPKVEHRLCEMRNSPLVGRLHRPRAEHEHLLVKRDELVLEVIAAQKVFHRVQVHDLAFDTVLAVSRRSLQHLRNALLEVIKSSTIPLYAGVDDRFLLRTIRLEIIDAILNIEENLVCPIFATH